MIKFCSKDQQNIINIHNGILASEEKDLFAKLKLAVIDSGSSLEGNLFYYHNTKFKFVKSANRRYNMVQAALNSEHLLEIGFNAGHSAALVLLSNPEIKVTSVDIAKHGYVDECVRILKERFGERFTFIRGDSKIVLPKLKCPYGFDMIHIDGCHSPVYANSDLFYSLKYSKGPGTIVIFDDIQKLHLRNLWDYYTNDLGVIHNKYDVFPQDPTTNTSHVLGVLSDPSKIPMLTQKQSKLEKGIKTKNKKKSLVE